MDFLQLVKDQRYSVRKFKDQAVEKEKLDLKKLNQCTSWYFGVPIALME